MGEGVQRLAEDLQLHEVVVDDERAQADDVFEAEVHALQGRSQPVEGQVHLGGEAAGDGGAGGVRGVLAADEDEFPGRGDGVAVAERRGVVQGGRIGDGALVGRHVRGTLGAGRPIPP
ncbi:hypothetical protein ADK57_39555 [Streptomyces sp. MMG1533]|nr:hypothetical protein ADK57_39555 [Streptomyces sp. MMG1533]